jgi:protein gp37
MEMFHPEIPSGYRDFIFREMEFYKKLIFIILTKMPERIDRPIPPNVWLGVSLTGERSDEYDRMKGLAAADALTKFVSFEPLLHGFDIWELFDEYLPDWIIVGRLTGHGKARDISRKAIQDIVDFAAEEDIPVFLKNNLREIWGAPLIQELP